MAKKKTPRKVAAKRKPAKKEIEFADGKNHLAEEAKEAQSLEKILGFPQKSPFQQNTASEFEAFISGMSLTELQELAVKAEVFPSGTKLNLKNKLIKAYSQYSQGGASKVVQVTKPIIDPESKQGKDLLKLIEDQS